MILANLRARLTADDFRLVIDVLGRGEPARRAAYARRLDAEGPDAVLDEPGLPRLLRDHPGCAQPSAALFLYVAVRHTLRQAGVDDVRLADYLGALLFEFGLRDRAWRVSAHDDATYRYLHEIVAGLGDSREDRRGFLLRVHLGNFSLWLAGLFPDYITHRRERRGGPDFGYYEALGSRGFELAAGHRLARETDLTDVYARAAGTFGRLRVALNRLADQVLFRGVHGPDRLLRQVADDARYPPHGGPVL